MHKTQRTFTREFKVEAVKLVHSSQKPLAQIARDLGIADSTALAVASAVLRAWRAGISRQWASDPARRGNSPAAARK